MEKLINYNFMTLTSNKSLDLDETFYINAGVSKVNDHTFNGYEDGGILFVKTDFIVDGTFQNNFLNNINKEFVLITGVSSYDTDKNKSYTDILNHPKLIKWFCTNPPKIQHRKISWLPIGFQEKERAGGNVTLLDNFYLNHKSWGEKLDKIYIPYHADTHPSRNKIIKNLCEYDFVDVESIKLPFNEYLSKLNDYKYILSLRGSGWDCHRHYESLLVGSIPILDIDSPLINLFKSYNLPVLSLNDIDTEIFSLKFNSSTVKEFLTMDYHINNIKSYYNEIL